MHIHHIAISVTDIELSSAFYQRIFHCEEAKRFERKDLGGRAVFLKFDNTIIQLWQSEHQEPGKDDLMNLGVLGIKHIAVQVDHLDETIQAIRAEKINVTEPKKGKAGHLRS